MKSKVISLSAISAALIAVSLTIGAYFEFADLFAVVIASAFVILPIYLKSYIGAVMAYLAGGVIAFLCSGFNILSLVFPTYFVFSGIYPIVKIKLQEKSFNKYLSFVIGLIWCLITVYGAYFYYTLIIGDLFSDLPIWVNDYILFIIGGCGIVFFFVFDRFISVIKRVVDIYLQRIIK